MQPKRLDLDIEAIRSEVLRRQHIAMKPFQEELRQLDILEQMADRHWSNGTHRRTSRPVHKTRPNGKPNGHARYAGLSQRQVALEILTKEPGLTANEIASRMVQGGYPFQTDKPNPSICTLMRQMEGRGEVKKTEPESREGGEANRYSVAKAKR